MPKTRTKNAANYRPWAARLMDSRLNRGTRIEAEDAHSPERQGTGERMGDGGGGRNGTTGGPVGSGTGGRVGSGTGGRVGSGSGQPVASGINCPFAVGKLKRFPMGGQRGLGWLRDSHDHRDARVGGLPAQYVYQQKEMRSQSSARGAKQANLEQALENLDTKLAGFKKVSDAIKKRVASNPATLVDNTQHCSDIEDQGQLGSCTAFSGVGMIEYLERRATNTHLDASQLFLYKTTRNLMGMAGDTGAYLRDTMKAMVLFGVPPDEYYPYDINNFDIEPDSFLYNFAANYKALHYMRLDPSGANQKTVLDHVKAALSLGYPAMFGFSVYPTLDENPDIPVPHETEAPVGGHAILAVGYNDDRQNWQFDPAQQQWSPYSKGALLIRNSWGVNWGDYGYGWLPYDYIENRMADDFWTCFKQEWVDLVQFN